MLVSKETIPLQTSNAYEKRNYSTSSKLCLCQKKLIYIYCKQAMLMKKRNSYAEKEFAKSRAHRAIRAAVPPCLLCPVLPCSPCLLSPVLPCPPCLLSPVLPCPPCLLRPVLPCPPCLLHPFPKNFKKNDLSNNVNCFDCFSIVLLEIALATRLIFNNQ